MDYFDLAERAGYTPNFWCSYAYASLAGWRSERLTTPGIEAVVDKDGMWMFPPVSLEGKPYFHLLGHDVWSDFIGWRPEDRTTRSKELDLEYIYDPRNFMNMAGGDWMSFRKNSRKWPRANPLHVYQPAKEETVEAMIGWLEGRQDNIFGADMMERYLTQPRKDVGIKGLFCKGECVAANVWDSNWKYINFRYSFVKEGEPFLAEFARLLFYTDPDILRAGKMVNDGGMLDNPGLKFFKDKMNPISVRQVNTWFV